MYQYAPQDEDKAPPELDIDPAILKIMNESRSFSNKFVNSPNNSLFNLILEQKWCVSKFIVKKSFFKTERQQIDVRKGDQTLKNLYKQGV